MSRQMQQVPAAGRRQVVAAARRPGAPVTPQLKPTTARLAVAAAIHRGEVYSYGWSQKAWRRKPGPLGGATEDVVTRWANDLCRCGLAEKPTGELRSDKVLLRLTEAGAAWWRRHDTRPTTTIQSTGAAL